MCLSILTRVRQSLERSGWVTKSWSILCILAASEAMTRRSGGMRRCVFSNCLVQSSNVSPLRSGGAPVRRKFDASLIAIAPSSSVYWTVGSFSRMAIPSFSQSLKNLVKCQVSREVLEAEFDHVRKPL